MPAIQTRLILTFAAALALPIAGLAKPARCVIQSGTAKYVGPCQFHAEKGGSFSLDPVKPKTHFWGATVLTIAMRGDGSAEVRGLTDDGINSMWGSVRRSRKDPACWVGLDLKICAY